MPMKSPLILAFAAFLGLAAVALAQDTPAVVVDPAIATMTNEQLVAARQDAMEQNGRTLRGAQRLSAESVAAATSLLQNFTNLPDLFREGSITGKSEALPLIWENWEDFRARFDKNAASSARMLAAAQANDSAAYGAAFKEIVDSCGGCHMMYRGKH